MASAHLSAKIVSRGSGHSAVAKAAYNAREELDDRRTGETHDYTRHSSKCLFEGIYAPKGAPEWAHDRSQLWNHVEAFERHRRAELAQDIDIALPHELTLEQNKWLLQDWVKENVTRKGLIADIAIHAPARHGDDRNIHAHVMIVRRKLDGSEFVRAKERFDTYGEKEAAKKADLSAMRESWEKLANRHLERHGHEARIDMGRKEDGEATLHMGRHATAQERRGSVTEIGTLNREIAAANENAKQMRERFDGHQAARAQIKEDLRQHRQDHAARDPAPPKIDLGEVQRAVQADHARQRSDRAQASRDGQRGANPARGDTAKAIGKGAGMLGEGMGKAAGGALGIVGGLLGAAARAVDGVSKSPPPKAAAKPRSLAEIAREVQAKQAAKPKEPEKDREQDKSRSRFEAVLRPAMRFLGAAVPDQYSVAWAIEARQRLMAYAAETGEFVLTELEHLNRVITGSYLMLGLTLTGKQRMDSGPA